MGCERGTSPGLWLAPSPACREPENVADCWEMWLPEQPDEGVRPQARGPAPRSSKPEGNCELQGYSTSGEFAIQKYLQSCFALKDRMLRHKGFRSRMETPLSGKLEFTARHEISR